MVTTRAKKGGEKDQTKRQSSEPGNQPAVGKPKNRVSAVKPAKSPDLKSPTKRLLTLASGTDGDDSLSVSGGSVRSDSSTASSRGIPLHIQKQLAFDIEAAGGIAAFKADPEGTEQAVSKLCEARSEIYGARGGPLREKIRKKVWYWRQLHKKGQYIEKVLNNFGVKSAANLKKAAKSSSLAPSSSDRSDGEKKRPAKDLSGKKQKQPRSSSSSSSSQSSSSSSSISSDHVARASEPPASVKDAPPAVIGITAKTNPKKKTAEPSPSRTDKKIHNSDLTSSRACQEAAMPSPPKPPGCSVIDVNVDCPEANRELLIFPINDIQGAKDHNAYYFGYFICFPIEHRWYTMDENVEHYKARVFSNNQLMVSLPSFDFTLLHNRDEVIQSNFPDNVISSLDNSRHVFDANKSFRQWKHLLLNFPDDQTLKASVIFEEAGEDEQLELTMHPVEFRDVAGNVTETKLYGGFTVARVDMKPHKRGRVEHKEKESKGAKLLKDLVAARRGG
jgi:hypothetical protein